MQIQVKDGYLTGYATVGGFPDGIEVDAALIEAIDPQKLYCYRYENGVLALDEENGAPHSRRRKKRRWKERYIPSAQNSMERSPGWRWRHWRRRTTTRVSGPPGCTRTGRPARMRLGTSRNAGGQTWEASRRTITRFTRISVPGTRRGTPSGVRCTGKARRPPARSSRCRARTICTRAGGTWWTDGGIYRCVSDAISRLRIMQAWRRRKRYENQLEGAV